MKHKDVTIKSVADLLAALKAQSSDDGLVWFRGHARSAWPLVPSLARRSSDLHAEAALLKRFMQNAVPYLARPLIEEWEWMFLMQHHRAPTRLLDWSESPLAALYFAVNEDKHLKQDGAVWCLDPVSLNKEARVTGFKFANEIPAFGLDDILNNYLPSRVDKSTTFMVPVAIVGPRNTARMAAQLGVFTVNHQDHKPIEKIDDFALAFSREPRTKALPFAKPAQLTVQAMANIFTKSDSLLRQVGMVMLYYHLFRLARKGGWLPEITRKKLVDFDKARTNNRTLFENGSTKGIDRDLIEFDGYAQSPNDSSAIRFRLKIMLDRIFGRAPEPDEQA